MVGGPPSGTVSFLFTDIEGSSLMWSRARDRMGGVVSRLIELANAATEAEGGTLVQERGEGDSHFPGLRPRLGRRAGSLLAPALDPVNQAARVRATAHGGQTVTSHVVAILAGTITISAWLPAARQRAGP